MDLRSEVSSMGRSAVSKLPTDKFVERKFKIAEPSIQRYECALSRNILLQGQMILTENNICFYSKFNDKTLFGKSTRVRVPYIAITSLKKTRGALALPNSITITCMITNENNAEEEITHEWTSYMNRDACWQLIQTMINTAHLTQNISASPSSALLSPF